LQCLEEAVQIEEGLGNLWDAARHRAGVALVRHRRGEQDIAVAHFERALPVLRSHGAPYYTIKPLLDAAELYLAMGRLEEAAGLTQEAADAARELGLDDAASQAETLANTIAAAPAEGHPAGAV
jgi:tetratricopeptide (TPR) repeat protein